MNFKKKVGLGGVNPTGHRHLSTDTPCPEDERLVTTANVTPKTTNSNSLFFIL
jgi:hypothetical protein